MSGGPPSTCWSPGPGWLGRVRLPTVLLVGLLTLTACSAGGGPDPSGSATAPAATTAPGTTPAPAPAAATPSPVAACGSGSAVPVSDAEELEAALRDARPGQTVQLADGRYEGTFHTTASGTAEQPIGLCGGRGAVLDGGPVDGDYTLHLDGASHWQLSGFTVTGGQKGVMVDGGSFDRIEQLMVTSTGDEAIHLRSNSTDNLVIGNTVRDTGLRKPQFGEGVYIGTAESNWCDLTDCAPDRSDRNVVEGNTISGTTAEAVDVKEGTSNGVLRGNRFDGSDMVEADSWVDVKGNDWLIEGNSGTGTTEDGFQVHEVVDGWGQGTVFRDNASVVEAGGYGINVAGPRTIRETTSVECSNTAEAAGSGLSNVTCG